VSVADQEVCKAFATKVSLWLATVWCKCKRYLWPACEYGAEQWAQICEQELLQQCGYNGDQPRCSKSFAITKPIWYVCSCLHEAVRERSVSTLSHAHRRKLLQQGRRGAFAARLAVASRGVVVASWHKVRHMFTITQDRKIFCHRFTVTTCLTSS